MKKKSSTTKVKTTAKNLEKRFARGASVLDYFDTENAIRRINLDIPEWALKTLDKESRRRGITRQALIKTWLVNTLDSIREKESA